MKKMIFATLLAAMLAVMAGCSSNNPSSSAPSTPSSDVSSSVPEESGSPESTPTEGQASETAQKFKAAIEGARDAEMNEAVSVITSAEDEGAEMILDVLGVSAEDMSDFAISVSPMNVKAYGVALIKPVEGKGQDVLDAVNGFVEKQQQSFENYLPDQGAIANAAIVKTLDDGTILLVMSEEQDQVSEAIEAALKQ